MPTENIQQVQVQAPQGTIEVYREVMTGIQTGSYAVLLSIAVVYIMTRKAIGNAWHKHFNMLDTLEKVQASNARSLRLIAESNKRIADLISDPRMFQSHNAIESIKTELTKAQTTLEVQLGGEDDI